MHRDLRRVVRCKSCDAPILWAKTSSGKNISIDAVPVPDGNVALYPGVTAGEVLADIAAELAGVVLGESERRIGSRVAL